MNRRDPPPPGNAAEELKGLYHDREPDPSVEEALVRHLRSRSERASDAAPHEPRGRSRRIPPWLQVAAGAVLFATGWGIGGGLDRTAPSESGTGYMLVLLEDERFQPESEPGGHAAEYSAWARSLSSDVESISGAELLPPFVSLSAGDGTTGEELPRVSGYFLVDLESRDAGAIRRLAESHPHLRHGGLIQVARLGG